jgi:hypothetical protein
MKRTPETAPLFELLRPPPKDVACSPEAATAHLMAQMEAKLPSAFVALGVNPRGPDADRRLLFAALGALFKKGFRPSKSLNAGKEGSKRNDASAFLAVTKEMAKRALDGEVVTLNKAAALVPYSASAGHKPEDLRKRAELHPSRSIAKEIGAAATVLLESNALDPLRAAGQDFSEVGSITILWDGGLGGIPESLAAGFGIGLRLRTITEPLSSLEGGAAKLIAAAARATRYGFLFIDSPRSDGRRGAAFAVVMARMGFPAIPTLIAEGAIISAPAPCIVIANGREKPRALFR